MIPFRVIVTVASLTIFGVAALFLDQPVLAGAAGGALAAYLGRVNGAATTNSTP